MANVVTTQVIQQGQRNVFMKLTGVLDTSNETRTIKVDVSALAPACTLVRIDELRWQMSVQLGITLDWDASSPITLATLTGFGHQKFRKNGGLLNNAGAGITGDIYLTTTGWASGTQTYTLWLWLVKQGVIA